ncbi:hypothetical protein ScalyP_jg11252 [Parmales sp. scaly parma]|nr:hypothetical protein ScalyP_jg11252 [Parmales sp. scaly parma]
MLIYKCRVSGEEFISDAYKLRPVVDPETKEEIPGLLECDSMKVLKGGGEIDVGAGNAFGGGGEDEAVDDTQESVNNIIDDSVGFGYNEMPMGKKDFKDWLKEYVPKVWKLLKEDDKVEPADVKAFKAASGKFSVFLLKKFDDLQFYVGPSFSPDGAMVLSYYPEGSATPCFIYIEGGLIAEKI